MVISSTLVTKASDSPSFLTDLEYSNIPQPTPAFSLMETMEVWFWKAPLFFSAAKLGCWKHSAAFSKH